MLDFRADEHPIAAQVSGHDPQLIAQAAAVAQERGVDLVDINAGCPARQVTGSGSGAALLRDLLLLEAILRAARRTITIPLTLKFRSGWDARTLVAEQVARLAEDCGCDAITLHPRTRDQFYTGQSDWRLIAAVVQAVRIPVWASGDVRSADDAQRCFQETGCAGLMVGRAAVNNPWILAQCAAALAGQEPVAVTPADRYHLLCRYIELLSEEWSETAMLGKIKYVTNKLHLGLPGKAAFRQRVTHAHSVAEARAAIDEYFAPYLSSPETGT